MSTGEFPLSLTSLLHVLAQFNVPVRQVKEMFPTVVIMQAEVDLHKRTPLRPLGLADEPHARFLRRAVGLFRIAGNAGADNILPRGWPAAVARNDMVQIQVSPVEHLAAKLAGVFVPLKNVVAGEFDFLLGQPIKDKQQDDARNANSEGEGV